MRKFPFLRARRWLYWVLLAVALALVCGCRTLSYYAQAIKGQYQILSHQQPIDRLIADPQTPDPLRRQLELVRELRVFAGRQLKLPVNGHYRSYVDVHRPYVVWNVQAARRYSLEPKTWWYPLVGRLEYRGFFSERGAFKEAERLQRRGYDVFVDGVDAYSTLGWFKDPVLNTFIDLNDPDLAEVIFHELGHQRLFARGDTDFNEAFATVVGQEGVRRWLQSGSRTNLSQGYELSLERMDEFVRLVLDTRKRLSAVYGDTVDKDAKVKAARRPPAPAEELQLKKEQVLADLRFEYAALRERWGGYAGYDAWFAHELNNAQLNTIANYFDYVPGFEWLLRRHQGDLEAFYQSAEELAKMPKEQRHEWLRNFERAQAGTGNTESTESDAPRRH